MSKIVAGICCCRTQPQTVSALIQLAQARVIDGWVVGSIGLLPFVRNNVIKQAYVNEPEFTHLLFIDDDMSDFTYEHVEALLEADKDIISGLISSRLPPYRLISCLNDLSKETIMEYIKTNKVKEEDHVGMAFTLIKRKVLDGMCQPCDIWFTMDRRHRNNFLDETKTFLEKLAESPKPEIERYREAVGWGMTSILGSELIGEDVEFCRRARAFGFKSYTHCGVIVGHIGTQPYTVRDSLLEKVMA